MSHLLSTTMLLSAVMLSICSMINADKPARTVPEGVTIESDVSYLPPDRAEKIDIYFPTSRGPQTKSSAVLLIHGGGWTSGDKAAAREFNIATTLVQHGYVCASVEYLKHSKDRWPTNLFDCKNAVRFLRKNAEKYQIDPDQIAVLGSSAGGHLALMVAYTGGIPELSPKEPYADFSDKVVACIDLYGITNLQSRREVDEKGVPTGQLKPAGLFSETRKENPEKFRLASPVNYVNASSPPTLILHGTIDPTVDQQQSIELAETLKNAGVEHQLLLLPGIGHTFDLQNWNGKPLPRDLSSVVLRFLDQHLNSERPAPSGK